MVELYQAPRYRSTERIRIVTNGTYDLQSQAVGSVQSWPAAPVQAAMSSWVPLAVPLPGSVRPWPAGGQPRGSTSLSTALAGAVFQSVDTNEAASAASSPTRASASASAGAVSLSAGETS